MIFCTIYVKFMIGQTYTYIAISFGCGAWFRCRYCKNMNHFVSVEFIHSQSRMSSSVILYSEIILVPWQNRLNCCVYAFVLVVLKHE